MTNRKSAAPYGRWGKSDLAGSNAGGFMLPHLMLRRFRRLAPIALLVCLGSGSARASTITQLFSLTDVLFTINQTYAGFSQFDSALGTLNSITFHLPATSIHVATTYTDTSGSGSVFSVSSTVGTFQLKDSKGEIVELIPSTASGTPWNHSVGPNETKTFDDYFSLSATTSVYNASGGKVSGPTGIANPIDASLFQGTSTLSLNVKGAASYVLTTSSGGGTSQVKRSATFPINPGSSNPEDYGYVQYDYTSNGPTIPEPITLAMMGSGLVFMGWLGRRRFAR
jgi:hypothetical protein